MDGEAPDAGGGALVWHPAIRALGWIKDWIIWAAFAGVLWETLEGSLTPTLSVGSILVHTGVICTFILCSAFPVLLIQNWIATVWRLIKNYPGKFAFVAVAIATLPFLIVASAYAWLAMLLTSRVSGVLQAITSDIPRYETPRIPGWIAFIVLLLLAVAVCVSLRPAVSRHRDAWRMMGPRKALKGYGIMTILRLRQTRREFFAQAPLIRDVRLITLAAVFLEIAHPNFITWPVAMLLIAASLAISLHLVQPPTWFFLGRSHFDSFHTFDALRYSWGKFGVTLLNRDSPEWRNYYFAHAAALVRQGIFLARLMNKPRTPRVWSLRSRGDLWASTVALLMDLVPVVVLDARERSYYVYDEVLWLAELNHIDKAWILGNPDGTAPALEGALGWAKDDNVNLPENAGRSLAARIVTEEQLLNAEWTPEGIRLRGAAAGA